MNPRLGHSISKVDQRSPNGVDVTEQDRQANDADLLDGLQVHVMGEVGATDHVNVGFARRSQAMAEHRPDRHVTSYNTRLIPSTISITRLMMFELSKDLSKNMENKRAAAIAR